MAEDPAAKSITKITAPTMTSTKVKPFSDMELVLEG